MVVGGGCDNEKGFARFLVNEVEVNGRDGGGHGVRVKMG